ncbi:selenocysteine lyase, PLP-dependent [Beijerinckiaceae bacterium RH AL1]|nr:cysteine desulfurase [Beijerinckiaceae bacterium]VVB45622.1 selenocysteine lyase, PLP-dependent [Beijerinckiaceae bacterium RH CH11]VVB45697.1 selenocysteine lyase, PLP-dependent [Beijerinckiaceae bacterium RH AL8]VVC54957.1 selenocysteine lyase, PLP-dependent [Beijerinckiaceae bacterium RH AL1]
MTHEFPKAHYDVDAIRADFPALSLEPYGKKLVYLDNGASAQKPRQVIERMTQASYYEYANVHRGLHYLANAATDNYEAARESVRAFLNAASTDEIVFTKSATEAINLVASSYGREHIRAGDEIVLTILEHHANIVPWHFLRESKGAVLKWVDCDDDGVITAEDVIAAITPKTKMVAITHMSNVTGTVLPIKAIVEAAHANGVPVLVDGSQGAVHLAPDMQELGADFYVMTGHKLYGPTGIGVLYARKPWLEKLPPFLGGGEMIAEVSKDAVTYNDPPHRFEAGTPPIIEAVGLGAALDYMTRIGREAIAAHEKALGDYAMERLGAMNALTIFGKAPGKGAIVSFEMKGAHAHDVATIIDRSGVAVRAGTHCAMPLLSRFGVTSTCRASFAMYNTMEEVDRLAEALRKAEGLFA